MSDKHRKALLLPDHDVHNFHPGGKCTESSILSTIKRRMARHSSKISVEQLTTKQQQHSPSSSVRPSQTWLFGFWGFCPGRQRSVLKTEPPLVTSLVLRGRPNSSTFFHVVFVSACLLRSRRPPSTDPFPKLQPLDRWTTYCKIRPRNLTPPKIATTPPKRQVFFSDLEGKKETEDVD